LSATKQWILLISVTMLAACTSPRPAPVEEREVDRRVRAPAEQDSAGVQVYPLQNPAVVQLTEQASAAESQGDYSTAAVLLERALRIRPRDPEILQHMAEVQLQQQDYEQALSFAVRSYDIGPRVGEICARNWRTIAVAREYLEDRAGAREAEQRAGQCMNTRPQGL
jgi:tetratricopeptide (TPR) repeat protein